MNGENRDFFKGGVNFFNTLLKGETVFSAVWFVGCGINQVFYGCDSFGFSDELCLELAGIDPNSTINNHSF